MVRRCRLNATLLITLQRAKEKHASKVCFAIVFYSADDTGESYTGLLCLHYCFEWLDLHT